jgi:protein arginine N-methyltransferase 1
VQVCQGETISGNVSCKPNAKNPRDLDIAITYTFDGRNCEAHRTQQYRMR